MVNTVLLWQLFEYVQGTVVMEAEDIALDKCIQQTTECLVQSILAIMYVFSAVSCLGEAYIQMRKIEDVYLHIT